MPAGVVAVRVGNERKVPRPVGVEPQVLRGQVHPALVADVDHFERRHDIIPSLLAPTKFAPVLTLFRDEAILFLMGRYLINGCPSGKYLGNFY